MGAEVRRVSTHGHLHVWGGQVTSCPSHTQALRGFALVSLPTRSQKGARGLRATLWEAESRVLEPAAAREL